MYHSATFALRVEQNSEDASRPQVGHVGCERHIDSMHHDPQMGRVVRCIIVIKRVYQGSRRPLAVAWVIVIGKLVLTSDVPFGQCLGSLQSYGLRTGTFPLDRQLYLAAWHGKVVYPFVTLGSPPTSLKSTTPYRGELGTFPSSPSSWFKH